MKKNDDDFSHSQAFFEEFWHRVFGKNSRSYSRDLTVDDRINDLVEDVSLIRKDMDRILDYLDIEFKERDSRYLGKKEK